MSDAQETDKNIEIWKIKKLIKTLESARGNGTGMISLIMPPRDQIARVAKMLGDEYGTASNIKSRVNRQSVLGAITSAQQRIKLYNKVPPNGLLLIFRPSLYLCDNKFHTEALSELLAGEENRRPNKNRTLANPPVFAKNCQKLAKKANHFYKTGPAGSTGFWWLSVKTPVFKTWALGI
jgi:peptide subunit release factor 1 (eRF1)